MSARRLHASAIALLFVLPAGCGVTRLQTARTVRRGETQTTVGVSLAHLGDRGTEFVGLPALPLDVMVRHGASDRVDWGIRNFFGFGLLFDMKWNLLDPARRTALAISGGLGLAADAGAVLHVPLTVSASHAVVPWFTPYAAVGYGSYWIFGYGQPQPGVTYASRTGTGDGLLTLHAGIELARATGRGVLFEYSIAFPVVNDPGDFYGFATNQFFSIAYHTGRGPVFSRSPPPPDGPVDARPE